jgi:hypothetical protein
MKRFACGLALLCSCIILHGQPTHGLTLKRTITLKGVTGKFDHFALDHAGNRLFASAAGPHAVEVIDLASGAIVETLPDIGKPHGVAWVAETGRLFVADGAKGTLDIFAGSPLKPVATIALSEDADDMVYDGKTKLLYVGHGGTDAANPARIAVVDADALKLVAELPVASHPEGLELDAKEDRILANIADSGEIAVIDGGTHTILATWQLGQSKGNTPLAYDSAQGLLLVGCRTPAQMLVIDGKDGKEMARAKSDPGADDLFYDPASHRAYVIAGSGAVDTFSVSGKGELASLPVVRTVAGAKTGLFDEQEHILYVGFPGISAPAEIRLYEAR